MIHYHFYYFTLKRNLSHDDVIDAEVREDFSEEFSEAEVSKDLSEEVIETESDDSINIPEKE